MEEFIKLIKRFEGLRLKAYKCPAGVWTIGYGSTGPGIRQGLVWTLEQAESRMKIDAQKFLDGAKALCPSLTGKRLSAVADFAYNAGLGNLKDSTLRKRVNAGDFAGAAGEFDKWVFAGGVKLKGLVLRRQAEKLLFLSHIG